MATRPKRKRLEKITDTSADALPFPSTQKFYCYHCGEAYSKLRGNFPVSHSPVYRGTRFLPICRKCVDQMFESYKQELGSEENAVRRMCMKLDLYWNRKIYEQAVRAAGINSLMLTYIVKTNLAYYADKTYDDTLAEEEKEKNRQESTEGAQDDYLLSAEPEEKPEISEKIKAFWGPGFTPEMYLELQDRLEYWMSEFPEGYVLNIGEKALIRQVCNLEVEINHARVSNNPIDKYVNALNTVMGSLNIKPVQKKNDESDAELENMPFGVGIQKWEQTRPVPEPDPELQDVDGIVRYISVWFLGHLCKMIGLKNTYCRMYEEEIERLKVRAPDSELDDEEDSEEVFNALFEAGGG